MSIGFDSIGSVSTGEIGQDDTIINCNGLTRTVTLTASSPPDLGVQVQLPSKTITLTAAAPTISAGKQVVVPNGSIILTGAIPTIRTGASVIAPSPPVITLTRVAPSIFTGNFVDARNTVTMITLYGEIASQSIAEGAIGEGEPSTRIVLQCPFIVLTTAAPTISAGKSEFVPTANISITSARAEIDSRHRKLRVMAIAS